MNATDKFLEKVIAWGISLLSLGMAALATWFAYEKVVVNRVDSLSAILVIAFALVVWLFFAAVVWGFSLNKIGA